MERFAVTGREMAVLFTVILKGANTCHCLSESLSYTVNLEISYLRRAADGFEIR